MKKILVSLIACFLMTAPVAAQYYPDGRPVPPRLRNGYHPRGNTAYYPNMYYGFRIGLGVGTVNSESDYLNGNKAQTGLNMGFVLGTQLTTAAPLFFETGIYYSEKGGKSTYDNQKFTYGLNYIEFPLLLKYKYYADRDFSIEPFVGGYLAYGVGGKIKDFREREAYNSFDENNFKRFDGGLRVGCGVGFQVMYLEASYDIGLANVGNDDFDDTHTGCLNLTFGVNF